MGSWSVKIGLPLVSLLLSGLLVFLPEYSRSRFTLGEQFLLCGGIFVLVTLIEILVVVTKLFELKTKEFASWTIRSKVDQELAAIRRAFFEVEKESYGVHDVFVDYFKHEISDLTRAISYAADNHELRVRAYHFQSVENVMSAFHGDSRPEYRFVWVIDRGDRLFDDFAWKHYFSLMTQMVRAGQIHQVETLLVLEDLGLLHEPRVDALVSFYSANEQLACAILSKRDFGHFQDDCHMPKTHIDFGIYGSRLVFLTESYDPPTAGVFIKDSRLIDKYTDFFRTVWNSPIAQKDLQGNARVTALDELMRIDEVN